MKRSCEKLILEYLSYFPCVVLIGARQTGKSTLIERFADGREVFDLERRADFNQIAEDPDLFLRLRKGPIAIDEAQLLPELFPALRVAIDKKRDQSGQYLLTGSSSPELLTKISESLAGRVGVIELAPFSYAETQSVETSQMLRLFSGSCSADDVCELRVPKNLNESATSLDSYWLHGGYPEPWLRAQGRFQQIWRREYLKTYIERDIARLFPSLNRERFRRFIELLASTSGTIINYANIATMLGVSQPTIKDYFGIAHGTFLWRNLPSFTKNASKRVVKHPRGYLRDTGLTHHMLQIPSIDRLRTHPQMGASWEALATEEVLRMLDAAGVEYAAYYYRTSAGAEVDLILEGEFGLIPIEIKHTQSVAARQLRPLRDFVEEFGCRLGIVINHDEKIRRYDEKLFGIPLPSFAIST